jgi:hypothetical protein
MMMLISHRCRFQQQRQSLLSPAVLAIKHAFFSSSVIEREIATECAKDDEWMKSDKGRQLLRKMIQLPYPVTPVVSKSISEYLHKRVSVNPDIAPLLLSTDSAQIRVLSQLFTFPLSLSYIINVSKKQQKQLNVSFSSWKALLLGARSEASLPRHWWMETMVSVVCHQTSILIDFSGPEIPIQQTSGGAQLINDKETTLTWPPTHQQQEQDLGLDPGLDHRTITIANLPQGRCKLHELGDASSILAGYDLLVMFNPGFGSPYLRDSWYPSIELLLQHAISRPGRVVVAATAHSQWDLQRDLAQLDIVNDAVLTSTAAAKPLLRKWIIQPSINPFGSKKSTFDGKEEKQAQIVTTNEYIYAFTYSYSS